MDRIITFFKSKLVIATVIVFIVLNLIIIKIIMFSVSYYTLHNQKIVVPDIKNLSVEESKNILEKKNMELFIIDTMPYNSKYKKDAIVRQIPEAGSLVKKGRKILVVINASTYKKVIVPDVLYLTKRQAINKLQIAGFEIGEEHYTDYYGRDIVLGLKYKGETINSGAKIPLRSKIDIILGNGYYQ